MSLTPQIIEETARLIMTIFIDQPDNFTLAEIIKKYDMNVMKQKASTMEKIIEKQTTDNESLVDDTLIPNMKKFITIVLENKMPDDTPQFVYDTEPNGQANQTNNETGQRKRKAISLLKKPDSDVTSADGDDSITSESDIHLSAEEKRRKRALAIYSIKQPKNLRLKTNTETTSHIFDWEPQPRGYTVYVKGPDYTEGILNRILMESKQSFGIPQKMYETKDYAVIILETEAYRQVVLETVQQSKSKLEAEASQYRFPIIKFEIDFEPTEDQIKSILNEIRSFNLKQFPTLKFELYKTYKIRGTPFTVVCVTVDPKIRDYLAGEGKGRLIFRYKPLLVQDFFNIKKCYGCGRPGHFSCPGRQQRCLRCSGPHRKSTCRQNFLLCPACRGPHEAFDITCSLMKDELNKDMNHVDYLYTKIMWSPIF